MQTNMNPAENVQIQVEDERTGMSVETLKRAFKDHLYYTLGKYDESLATQKDYYMALAYTVRDRLLHRFNKTIKTYINKDVKRVCYLICDKYVTNM